MNNRIAAWSSGVLIIGMLIAAGWALTRLPRGLPVPIHYDISGAPNWWAPAYIALFILPVAAAFLWMLRVIFPRITPRGPNLVKSPVAYGTIWVAATVAMALIQAHTIAAALGHPVNVAIFVTALIGCLFIVTGNVLGKLRWNYVVGIRTPWTLADERVWDKTHRFGGWLFVIGGLVLVTSALLSHYAAPKPFLVLGVIAAIVLMTFVKSYLLWREQQRNDR